MVVVDGSRVEETTATTGTGLTIVLTAKPGFGRFAPAPAGPAAFIVGAIVPYVMTDGGDWETGLGTIQTGNTFDRTTPRTTLVAGVYDDTTPARINLSGSATIFAALDARDVMNKSDTSFTNALWRIGAVFVGADSATHINIGETCTTGEAYDSRGIFCAGRNNVVRNRFSSIAGGEGCDSDGRHSFIGGGQNNSIQGFGVTSIIGAGNSNVVDGFTSGVLGGVSNTTKGTSCAIGGGASNDVRSSLGTIPGGRGNGVAHLAGVAFGGASLTRADYDVVFGAAATDSDSVANNTIRLAAGAGNILIDGAVSSPEADYAEQYEWADGNVDDEDRVALFVCNDGKKVFVGEDPDDGFVLGIMSANPAVIGDAAPNHWTGMYLKDEVNRPIKVNYARYTFEDAGFKAHNKIMKALAEATKIISPAAKDYSDQIKALKEIHKSDFVVEDESYDITIYENVETGIKYSEYPQPTNIKGTTTDRVPEKYADVEVIQTRTINPDYDASKSGEYLPRNERIEFDAIGTHGKLFIKTSEPITGKYVDHDKANPGYAKNGTTYRVYEVISDTLARVILK